MKQRYALYADAMFYVYCESLQKCVYNVNKYKFQLAKKAS